MKLMRFLAAGLLVLCAVTIVAAQAFGLPPIPTDVTVNDAILKYSVWAIAVVNLGAMFLSQWIPLLNRIDRKYYRALAVAIAVGITFVKFGVANIYDAVTAFALSSFVYESFFKKKTVAVEISDDTPPQI